MTDTERGDLVDTACALLLVEFRGEWGQLLEARLPNLEELDATHDDAPDQPLM
jgi:hypothetical protein